MLVWSFGLTYHTLRLSLFYYSSNKDYIVMIPNKNFFLHLSIIFIFANINIPLHTYCMYIVIELGFTGITGIYCLKTRITRLS